MNGIAKKIIFNHRLKRAAVNVLKSKVADSFPYRLIYSRLMHNMMEQRSKSPTVIGIEGTNVCNADCIICPHKNMKRGTGVMPLFITDKIVRQAKELGAKIRLNGFGEPFMDPLLKHRIRRAAGAKEVSINTNGMYLDPYIDGVDVAYVSIDAVTERTYKSIRPGLDFKQVKLNTKRLIQRGKVKVIASMVENMFNCNEVDDFVREWEDAYAVSISLMHQWDRAEAEPRRDPCVLLWSGLEVQWNGDVCLCCLDYEGKHILGNVNYQSLKSIWFGDKLREVREKHKQGVFDGICKNCGYNAHYKSPWWVM